MKTLLIPCVAFCSLALSGCSVAYSVNPLNTKDDAVDEPALAGEWTESDSGDGRICVQQGESHTYTMIVFASDSKDEKATKVIEAYEVRLVRLEDQLFADLVAKGQLVNGTEVDPPAGALYHHLIVKLDVNDSELSYTVLSPSAIREANQQGYAPLGYVEVDDGILLTASTEDLRWSVSHFADRLFGDADHFNRVTETRTDDPPSPCSAIPPS